LPLGDESIQNEFCDRIRHDGWSVRETERAVSDRIRDEEQLPGAKPNPAVRRTKNPQLESLEKQFRLALGTRVRIRQNPRGRGTIQIDFNDSSEFERLRQCLVGDRRDWQPDQRNAA
jgi:ParB family chromosome partitioning protein